MNIKTGTLEINNAHIYYEEAGTGPALVMVHAAIANLTMWDDQFKEFASDHRVVRFDMRGFGRSPMTAGVYSGREDLWRLMQALEIEKAALMGCSLGGMEVIDFAVEHPEAARALILVDASLSGFNFEGDMPRYWEEMQAAIKAKKLDEAAEYAARIWLDAGRKPAKIDPAVRQRVLELAKDSFKQQPAQGKYQPLTPPAIERLDALQMPTLLIAGERDDKNILHIADLLSFTLPNTKKVILSDAAHLPNLERPEDFNQVVRGFLEGIGM